jgi:hypothetical protein
MEPYLSDMPIGYASYESYPVPSKFAKYYEAGHRVRKFIQFHTNYLPKSDFCIRTVNLWACGCLGNSAGELRGFGPGEIACINRVEVNCEHHDNSPLHTLTKMTGDEELEHLVVPAREMGMNRELPRLPPVKHVSFSTEKPAIIGRGAYGLNFPSKDVRSVNELRKAVATTFDEMEWVKPMEKKNSTGRWRKTMKKFFNRV